MLIDSHDPRIVNFMSQIQHCNITELKELLNEDTQLESMIRNSQTIKQQEAEKDVLLASNKSLAEYNLTWEPKVNVGRQRLIELYQTASQLGRTVEEKDRKIEECADSVPLETAIVLLDSAAAQAEEESENIAVKFLDKTLDVENFIEEFQMTRKKAHLRKVKADKMKELVAKQKQSAPGRPAPAPPLVLTTPLSLYPAASQSSLPYPLFPPTQPSNLPYPLQPHSLFQPPRF